LNEDDTELVMGIGSVLDRRHAADRLKIVLGTGYGGYEPLPKIDHSWVIHWVRGPRTAAVLKLHRSVGIGDPAMLLPFAAGALVPQASAMAKRQTGFMPHFESLRRGDWKEAARVAGVQLIDPRSDPHIVLREIADCRLLISEAMHGAIVADTLRVPWIAIEPQATIHRSKWHDWAGAVGLTIRFQVLPPSSLYEWVATGRLAGRQSIDMAIQRVAGPLQRIGARQLIDRAADALRRLACGSGQLSEPDALRQCQDRMMACLDHFRRHPRVAPDTNGSMGHPTA
jgi:succinoglycan biosynthesis protein ExoV